MLTRRLAGANGSAAQILGSLKYVSQALLARSSGFRPPALRPRSPLSEGPEVPHAGSKTERPPGGRRNYLAKQWAPVRSA